MRLSLNLLGAFQITLDGEPVTGFESDKVRALLAYLALEADRPHRRDALAEMLWPDRPQGVARNNLKQALANLRKVIGDREADPPFLIISRANLQFNLDSAHWVDAKECDALLVASQAHRHRLAEMCESCTHRFRQVAALYQGTFLEHFYLGDSTVFEEWALFRRERLQRQVMKALRHLTAYHERRGNYREARQFARRQVELEPWDEAAQRQLMRTLALSGRRSAALKQYQVCRRILADELGVEPANQTTELFEQIRDGEYESSDAVHRETSVEARGSLGSRPLGLPAWAMVSLASLVLGLGLSAGLLKLNSRQAANQTSIPRSEHQALVTLYNETQGPGWKEANGWLSDFTPCVWFGVTCSEGTVTELTLPDNDLGGRIPPEISQLTNLTVLDLGFNQLSGPIPPGLGSLNGLRQLTLAGNIRLSGTIPPELGDLTGLEELVLSSDRGGTQLSGSIPPQLGNLRRLVLLELSNSMVSGPIPPKLGNLTNLMVLDLSFNRLSGPIPPEIGNLSNLRSLVLHGNSQLSGPIPSELGDLVKLEQLILSNEQGGTRLSGPIPPQLGNLTKLRHLAMSNSLVSGPIPPELGNLTDLTYLDLARTPLSGPIPPELGNLVNLQTLSVGEVANELEGPLPLSLMNLQELYYFTYGNLTHLCEPPDPAFQEWLNGIPQLAGPRVLCQSEE
jgi:DNA-binding SARP family transcriptional activator/Leucine-rich repeat (LRR) protein